MRRGDQDRGLCRLFPSIDARQVVTFDAYGVSGHINHKCTHRGVGKYMEEGQFRHMARFHVLVGCFT